MSATDFHAQAQVQDASNRAIDVIGKLSSKEQPVGGERMPQAELANCAGVAFTFVKKAGAVITVDSGHGFVLAKYKGPDGTPVWSAPLFISTFSGGLGLTLGFSQIDSLTVLDTPAAVERYTKGGSDIGTEMTAVGPLGKVSTHEVFYDFELGDESASYSVASGALIDYSMKGVKYSLDVKLNLALYGAEVTPQDILSGKVPVPPAMQPAYEVLTRYMHAPRTSR